MLTLGPMDDEIRDLVQRLVAESRPNPPHADERLNGFYLTGGPGGANYLDGNGETWHCHWDFDGSGDIVEHVPDGPRKVALIAIAAEGVPELAAWLPVRPEDAKECAVCHGSCNLPPPASFIQCPACCGLGWVE